MGTQRPVGGAVGVVAVALVGVLTGCSEPPGVAGGEPVVETAVPHTGPADDLAPSQRTASTVPRPATPPPCDPDVVEVVATLVTPSVPPVGVTFRVTNLGTVWCEVDLSGSSSVDGRMEPDVWLEPGGAAELLVSLDVDGCDAPADVDAVEVDVNGSTRSVPFAPVVAELALCGWRLMAFAPLPEPSDASGDGA